MLLCYYDSWREMHLLLGQVIQNFHMRLIIAITQSRIQKLKCRVETISES